MEKSKAFLLYTFGLLTLFACSPETQNDLPTAPPLGLSASTQCLAECAITTDTRPFEASRSSPDSATGSLFLADVTLKGSPRATVSLGITADPHLVAALPADTRILVNADGKGTSFKVSELALAPIIIYRFEAATSVRIRYALSRGTPTRTPVGDIRLTQQRSHGGIRGQSGPTGLLQLQNDRWSC